ncbi:hypothetical protein [Marininema halotolerans]|uniref:Uncharacterized protein n=1 Tax=Marininema halotolerans TaxID=1155944 RepID=A0A1I6PZP5_9BACL|nr:hypothetical protein [Marininema halotolerans]SFS45545.1 hypothetical protein SAMN05444972_102238 [Marininema halotolerans]
MEISKFVMSYDLHDSNVEKYTYLSQEHKVILDIELCNWRQRAFQKGQSEITMKRLIFDDVEDVQIEPSNLEIKDFEILTVDTTMKNSKSLKMVLHDEGIIIVMVIIAGRVYWEK